MIVGSGGERHFEGAELGGLSIIESPGRRVTGGMIDEPMSFCVQAVQTATAGRQRTVEGEEDDRDRSSTPLHHPITLPLHPLIG